MHAMHGDVPVWGASDDYGALNQILRCRSTAVGAAMMADHHLGYSVPIGGVVVYRDQISPSGVGYDIACGNKAVRLDIPLAEVRANISTIMDDIAKNISFGMGRNNDTPVEHPMFEREREEWKHPAVSSLKRMAENQLGTVGGGNHYVDVFADEEGRVWVGCHFGSRGLGHKTATWFLKANRAVDAIDAMPLVLDTTHPMGEDYLSCMHLAGEYAYAGRDWVCARVAEMMGASIVEEVHNHHNFAWKEDHGGESLWVVRKGATPAWPGQRGFVGASMGEPAYIIEGVDSPQSVLAYRSTVHGAGRVMSRTAAKGKTDRKTGEVLKPGLVTREAMSEWIARAGVELRGGDLDEAPQAYKRLDEVLGHHSESIAIVHTLTPLGVVMAGKEVYDPFKD